jgi:hypothetical protein
MKTAVTNTSIEAYHTHSDKQNQLERFARFVLARTEAGQRTWDRLVYRETGILPNTVSARRNELEKMGTITIDGAKYHLTDSGASKDPITGKRINTYALVLAQDSPQLTLFQ